MENSEKLTDQEFWDSYWNNISIPQQADPDVSFDRGLISNFDKVFIDNFKGKTILEIGCAPGKWMSHFANRHGMIPYGLDYSKSGMEATRRNLEYQGIDFGDILDVDFFNFSPTVLHDVVISLGFIEHFEDPSHVIKLHLEWLKPGGFIVLGVPNFRGINYLIQKQLDQEILNKHNLEMMTLNFFENITKQFDLNEKLLSYIGGFEPTLFIDGHKAPPVNVKILNKLIQLSKKIRKSDLLDNINHKNLSGYILYVAQKSSN